MKGGSLTRQTKKRHNWGLTDILDRDHFSGSRVGARARWSFVFFHLCSWAPPSALTVLLCLPWILYTKWEKRKKYIYTRIYSNPSFTNKKAADISIPPQRKNILKKKKNGSFALWLDNDHTKQMFIKSNIFLQNVTMKGKWYLFQLFAQRFRQ